MGAQSSKSLWSQDGREKGNIFSLFSLLGVRIKWKNGGSWNFVGSHKPWTTNLHEVISFMNQFMALEVCNNVEMVSEVHYHIMLLWWHDRGGLRRHLNASQVYSSCFCHGGAMEVGFRAATVCPRWTWEAFKNLSSLFPHCAARVTQWKCAQETFKCLLSSLPSCRHAEVNSGGI